jgi:hypothetical protein
VDNDRQVLPGEPDRTLQWHKLGLEFRARAVADGGTEQSRSWACAWFAVCMVFAGVGGKTAEEREAVILRHLALSLRYELPTVHAGEVVVEP